ncbi:SusC/RagA family TonB-linked outer membrane protein [Chitinophaga agrisoli]|uniref:SusC/RagA family TonB-linked outer membrane protein n=1 Tax=Chitinophaga agrisoli TaxID=2607653 RepID=A0A5B2VJT5_9BACT|nr:SusC/RagA family TonB-linked outer membrane protein [Chitinophaga agrisoli]KAA2239361.1 SusC/RagA family TonB-linked outer membrane protein [Chitinophaga agrisoli]
MMQRTKKHLLKIFALILSLGSWPLLSEAQEAQLKGKVLDAATQQSIEGATVVIQGTTKGARTLADGTFSLNAEKDAVLIISSIGYEQQHVTVKDGFVNITMNATSRQLQDVVVTALGITSKKRAVGYSIQEVKGETMTQARETNLVNALAGRVAGVNIVNGSNSIGGSSKIVIRGETSLAGNNQPLFVVDGIPIDNSNSVSSTGMKIDYGNGAGEINPDDIENISVLKGPTAAALYGSRAGNGVVLITTKKGKAGQGIGVSVNSTTSIETVMLLPTYQNGYGQGRGGVYNIGDGGRSWGPPLDGRDMKVPVNTEYPPKNGEVVKWVPYPDNVKEFYQTGRTLTNNVAVSGGNDKGTFRVSYTNLNQTGLVPNTDQKRDNVALNAGYKITDKLTINTAVNYINTNSKNRTVIGYGNESPVYTWIWEGRQVRTDKMRDYWFKGYEGTQPFTYNYTLNDNPYFGAYENLNGMQKDRWIGNVSLNYQFTPELSLMVRTGMDQSNERRDTRRSQGTNSYRQGMYRLEKLLFQERNSDFLLTYQKSLNSDWTIKGSVGGNQMRQKQEDISATAGQLSVPGVYNLGNSSLPLAGSQYDQKYAINSLYGYGQAAYKNAIFLDVTARNDWSSSLPAANNSYFYPSVSLSGVFTDFMKLPANSPLSFGKVRLSWARVGNDTRPYRLRNVYGYSTAWSSLQTVAEPSSIANADLLPEMLDTYEMGTELKFFNNRVGLDFTYYNTVSKNQILSLPLDQTSGYTTRFLNAGKIQSHGFEVMLNLAPVRSKNFQWDIMVNWSASRAKVVELVDGLDTYSLPSGHLSNQARVGGRMGDMYGTTYKRDADGNIIYLNGLPQDDPTLKKLGNYNPDWIAGISNTFNYKGFVASFLLDWKYGGQIYDYMYVRGNEAGQLIESLEGREHGIVGKGVMLAQDGKYVPNNVNVSAETYWGGYFNGESGTFDATWLKLREVKLGYVIPRRVLGRFPIKDISIMFVGRNLLLWTKVPHVDPDTSSMSGDAVVAGDENFSLPSARSFGLNLNFKF